jgi:hypothetical protein
MIGSRAHRDNVTDPQWRISGNSALGGLGDDKDRFRHSVLEARLLVGPRVTISALCHAQPTQPTPIIGGSELSNEARASRSALLPQC